MFYSLGEAAVASVAGAEAAMGWVYDEAKLTEMVLFFAEGLAGERYAGSTKLNKLLWFADTAHVRQCGEPISGAEYQRLPQGPAPRRLVPVRRALAEAGDARVRPEPTGLGRVQDRLEPGRRPDLSVFSDSELRTLREVLDEYGGASGHELSEASHEEPGWLHSADGETIPLASALIDPDPEITDEMRSHARSLAQRFARLPPAGTSGSPRPSGTASVDPSRPSAHRAAVRRPATSRTSPWKPSASRSDPTKS